MCELLFSPLFSSSEKRKCPLLLVWVFLPRFGCALEMLQEGMDQIAFSVGCSGSLPILMGGEANVGVPTLHLENMKSERHRRTYYGIIISDGRDENNLSNRSRHPVPRMDGRVTR